MKKFKHSSGKALFVAGIFLWAFAFVLKNILHFSDKVFFIVFIMGLLFELIGVILIVKHTRSQRKKH